MYRFFQANGIKYVVYDELPYYKLTYKKILSDLPILGIKKRQLVNILNNLQAKNIISKISSTSKDMYIHIFTTKLMTYDEECINNFLQNECNKLHPNNTMGAIDYKNDCNRLHSIENYNINNYLYIKLNNILGEVDIISTNSKLQKNLSTYFSSTTYKIFFNDLQLIAIQDTTLIFSTSHLQRIKDSFLDKLTNIIKDSIIYSSST